MQPEVILELGVVQKGDALHIVSDMASKMRQLLLHAVDKPSRFANRDRPSRSRTFPNGARATRSRPSFTEVSGPISKAQSLFRNFGPRILGGCISVLLWLH
jgi:hypothetical protein